LAFVNIYSINIGILAIFGQNYYNRNILILEINIIQIIGIDWQFYNIFLYVEVFASYKMS